MASRLMVVISIIAVIVGCTTRNEVKIGKPSAHIPGISYSGGSGESFHDAVKINGARDKSTGVAAEYKYISDKYGARGSAWFLVGQTVIREKNKIVDVVEIQLGNNPSDRRIYYFDVSDFLGKKR